MTRMKAFCAVAALTLLTVGVFAGKSKFLDTYRIYGFNTSNSSWVEMTSINNPTFAVGDEFQLGTLGVDVPATASGTSSYELYYYDISTGHVGPKNPILVP